MSDIDNTDISLLQVLSTDSLLFLPMVAVFLSGDDLKPIGIGGSFGTLVPPNLDLPAFGGSLVASTRK
jgi:hypothetical protein